MDFYSSLCININIGGEFMIIDICDGYIIDCETGKNICCIDEIHCQSKEIIYLIITSLIEERDSLLDVILDKDYRIQTLEEDIEMFEDNWGIEE